MKKSLLLPIIGALLFGTVIASGLVFQEVLPNTVDDAALEYIQIINVSCTDIEMSGIMISDISAKTYTLPVGILAPGGIRRIPRSESKLILNNSDERLEMRSSTGELLDTLSYAISTRDLPIVSTTYTVQSCIPISPVTPLENTGSLDPSTSSGVSFSGGVTFSGESQTGVTTLEDFFSGSLTSSGSWSGSFSGSTLSGTSTESGEIALTGSLVFSGGTDTSLSGGSILFSGPPSNTLSGSILPFDILRPTDLYLYDRNQNTIVDELEIVYTGLLTGSVDLSRLLLYSSTGWLAPERIESTGSIVQASLSGSSLVLSLLEGTLSGVTLKIDDTPTSHLRLKSLSGFGLLDTMGRNTEALTYTQSFSGYAGVYIHDMTRPVWLSPSVLPVISSSSIYTPPITSINPPHSIPSPLLPQIFIQSWLTSTGVCTGSPCRVNVTSSLVDPQVRCIWDFGYFIGDTASTLRCNPTTITLLSSTGQIRLGIYRIGDESRVTTTTLSYQTKQTSSSTGSVPIVSKALISRINTETPVSPSPKKLISKSKRSSKLSTSGLSEVSKNIPSTVKISTKDPKVLPPKKTSPVKKVIPPKPPVVKPPKQTSVTNTSVSRSTSPVGEKPFVMKNSPLPETRDIALYLLIALAFGVTGYSLSIFSLRWISLGKE